MKEPWVPIAARMFDPDHELAGEPVCKRWAWADLCYMAQRKDRRIVVGLTVFDLRRGELFAAVRFLSERWNWSRSRVHRFLQLLQAPGVGKLTLVRTTQDGSVYRLVTFDEYALGGESDPNSSDSRGTEGGTQIGTPSGTDNGTDSGTGKAYGAQGDSAVPRDADRDGERDADWDASEYTSGTNKRGIYTSSSTARGSKPPTGGVNQARLSKWLGEGMEATVATLAGERPEVWCQAFLATWVDAGGSPADERFRVKAGEDAWRDAVREAMSSIVLEGHSYSQRLFRSIVRDRLQPEAPQPKKRGPHDRNPMSVGVLR